MVFIYIVFGIGHSNCGGSIKSIQHFCQYCFKSIFFQKINNISINLVPPRAQISSGSGSACWAKFGFGFHRVFKFQQCSGSGLSGFTFDVRVLGFFGFGLELYY